jgi:hypothetical protein
MISSEMPERLRVQFLQRWGTPAAVCTNGVVSTTIYSSDIARVSLKHKITTEVFSATVHSSLFGRGLKVGPLFSEAKRFSLVTLRFPFRSRVPYSDFAMKRIKVYNYLFAHEKILDRFIALGFLAGYDIAHPKGLSCPSLNSYVTHHLLVFPIH